MHCLLMQQNWMLVTCLGRGFLLPLPFTIFSALEWDGRCWCQKAGILNLILSQKMGILYQQCILSSSAAKPVELSIRSCWAWNKAWGGTTDYIIPASLFVPTLSPSLLLRQMESCAHW